MISSKTTEATFLFPSHRASICALLAILARSSRAKISFFVLAPILLLFLTAFIAQATAQTVATDAADYAAGEIATITGSGWVPGEVVALEISQSPQLHAVDILYTFADTAGNIRSGYVVFGHDIAQTFTLIATGQTSGSAAPVTFTNSVDFISIAPPTTPSGLVQADKADYLPDETAIITGTGWLAGETVTLEVIEDPLSHPAETLHSIADNAGSIVAGYVVDEHDRGRTFTLTVTGMSSGLTAQTVFTDADGIDLFEDAARLIKRDAFAWGSTVYGKFEKSQTQKRCFMVEWRRQDSTVQETDFIAAAGGARNADFTIPVTGPSGIWKAVLFVSDVDDVPCATATFTSPAVLEEPFDVARVVIIGAGSNSATTADTDGGDNYVNQDGAQATTVQATGGLGQTLEVRSRSGSKNERAFLRFDLSTSGIPSGATIDSAQVRLFLDNAPSTTAGSRKYDIYGVTSAWREDRISFTAGAVPPPRTASPPSPPAPRIPQTWKLGRQAGYSCAGQ